MNCVSQNSFLSSNCQTIGTITLVASGILLIATGIWQLKAPFICKYPSAGWGLIGGGGLNLAFVILLVGRTKKEAETTRSVNGVPQIVPEEDMGPRLSPKTPVQIVDVASDGPEVTPNQFATVQNVVSEDPGIIGFKDIWPHIFPHLDWYSLMASQLVCKYFYQIVNGEKFKPIYADILRSKKDSDFRKALEKDELHLEEINFEIVLLTFSYANETLFTVDEEGIGIWKSEKGKQTWNKKRIIHTKRPSTLLYQEERLFTIPWDQTVFELWKLDEKNGDEKKFTGIGHNRMFTSLAYGDNQLFTGGYDKMVKIWREDDQGTWTDVNFLLTKSEVISLFYIGKGLVVGTKNNIQIWKPIPNSNGWWNSKTLEVNWWSTSLLFANYEYLMYGESGAICIMKRDQNENYKEFQNLAFNIPQGFSTSNLFVKEDLLFAKLDNYSIGIAEFSKGLNQWRWISTLKSSALSHRVETLVYAEGKLFSGCTDKLQIWTPWKDCKIKKNLNDLNNLEVPPVSKGVHSSSPCKEFETKLEGSV